MFFLVLVYQEDQPHNYDAERTYTILPVTSLAVNYNKSHT